MYVQLCVYMNMYECICSVKDDADVVVFMSKMMPVRVADLSKRYIYIYVYIHIFCIHMCVCICMYNCVCI
jgi:hypothetical protein